MLILALVPHLVLDVVQIRDRLSQVRAMHVDASRDLARASGSSFMNYLDRLWDTQLALGHAILLLDEGASPEELEELLRAQFTHHPALLSMRWLDPTGEVVVHAKAPGSPLHPSPYRESGAKEHIHRILAGEDRALSDILVHPDLERPVVEVARGVFRRGRLAGILVACVDFSKLGAVLPESWGTLSDLGLVDRAGATIYNAWDAERSTLSYESSRLTLAEPGKAMPEGYVFHRDGREWIGAGIKLARTGWIAFAESPAEQVYALSWAAAKKQVSMALLATGAALAAGLAASRAAYDSVRAFQKAAAALSQGDFGARVGLEGRDALAAAGESFDAMARRIEELEESRSRLVYATVHELRDPLASAKAVVQLARARANTSGDSLTANRHLAIVERELDRMGRFLEEFLDAYRVQQGSFKVSKERVDLVEVVGEALSARLLDGGSGEGPELVVEGVASGPITVLGDAYRIEQVVRNLVRNALKYSPLERPVRVGLEVEGEWAELTVSDEGPGIPGDELPRVFEHFFQGRNQPRGAGDGMGLGLYICREIVRQHGGEIRIESAEGRGTRVYMRLPLHRTGA